MAIILEHCHYESKPKKIKLFIKEIKTMAHCKNRTGKKGIITYLIQTKVNGKGVSITWKNHDGLSEKKAKKAAEVFGELWEKDLRNGIIAQPEKDDKKPLTFSEMCEAWYTSRENKFSESYKIRAKDIMKRFNNVWADKLFSKIEARDVERYFVGLNNHKYNTTVARVKVESKDRLSKAVLDYGVRKIRSENISHPTVVNARKGGNIQWNSAELICATLGLPVDEIFEKVSTGKPYKRETILKFKRILSSIFNYAIKYDMATKNYASSLYLKDVVGGEEADEIQILSNDENDRLLDVLDRHPIEKTMPIYLMMLLGIRKAEVCGLEWKDIDFDKRILRITRNRIYIPKKGIIVTKPKTTTSRRDLYIIDELYQKILYYKAYVDEQKNNDPEFDLSDVLYCDYRGRPANPDQINKLLKSYLAEADCTPITSHKLRHGFITQMIDAGVPIATVSRLAGHSSIKVTLDVYTQYRKCVDNSKEIMEKIFTRKMPALEQEKNATA